MTVCHSGAVRSLRTWRATRRWLLGFEEIVLDTPSVVLVLIGGLVEDLVGKAVEAVVEELG